MSTDQMESYTIAGKRYAARSIAQALYAHRVAINPRKHKLQRDAKLARTQPYPDNTGAVATTHARGGSHNGK